MNHAVIIGGTRGIGAGIAATLSRDGWRVTATGVSEDEVAAFRATRPEVATAVLDVTDTAQVGAFFDGLETFAARDEITAFYLTDFLVRQFDAFVWEPLGLDRHPQLRDMYFGHYETLVYLAQTEDPALTAKARVHADRLGLAFERRFTGYGDLARAMEAWAL